MPKKDKQVFVCKECGFDSPRWEGQCPNCGVWNSLVAMQLAKGSKSIKSKISKTIPQSLETIETKSHQRILTGIHELDRCLGEGFVHDETILIAGEPGIGKSTLILQVAESLSKFGSVLYVCGEESPHQIKIRAERLKLDPSNIAVYAETKVSQILDVLASTNPTLVVIDSIQTMECSDLDSTAGSPMQIRESTLRLIKVAKEKGIILIIVGHITKEGAIAGPKLLEHMVDAVLYLEGDPDHNLRILRVSKNRFGNTQEVGVFKMDENGMIGVDNPSMLFLEGKLEGAKGSVICPVMNGNRCFLLEVQALTAPTAFNYPRRTVSGVDINRVLLIIAILSRSCGIDLSHHDVFVSLAGGVKLKDVGLDLAIGLSLVSSVRNLPLKNDLAAFGEVGLSGEIRSVNGMGQREKEATRLGYKDLIEPGSIKSLEQAVKKSFVQI